MEVMSGMAGTIWKILVQEGERVEEGQEIAIIESMKMEIPVEAPASGTVKKIVANEGDFVNDDTIILHID